MTSDRIPPEEVNARILAGEPIVFLDNRNPTAWAESNRKIPGAIRVPSNDVEAHLHEIDRASNVVTYCT
jgi:rhodanese-related sulfurtransferase